MASVAAAIEAEGVLHRRERQSLAGLRHISFGFFGIQIGFALQNANMSRIFQSLGTSLVELRQRAVSVFHTFNSK